MKMIVAALAAVSVNVLGAVTVGPDWCVAYPEDGPTDFDCRSLAEGRDTLVSGKVSAPKAGEALALWLPDEMMPERPEYAIRLAGGADVVENGGKILNVVLK